MALIRRLAEFTNQYPWQWACAELEAFFDMLRSAPRPAALSTLRGYQTTMRLFQDFVTDTRYGWPQACRERFGQAPAAVLHEWNSMVHAVEYEGRPGRRPLTYDEVQVLFDTADQRVDDIRSRGRKGALVAVRDAAVLKAVYAYGLRRREACGLDLADLRHNPSMPAFGRFGALFVRLAKASRGSAPKRRTVLTVPEMDWIVAVLDEYLTEVRPRLAPAAHPALWVSERTARLSVYRLGRVFEIVRDLAGLPEELDLHGLRHSYVTHLVEFDIPRSSFRTRSGTPSPRRRRSTPACRTSSVTNCCATNCASINPAWRRAGETENGLPVEPASGDGRTRNVRHHGPGRAVG
ncbi:tyrosine-type recombinase/integrase [Rugosimonospora africana]|uniref:tyrosine-type recombinase/integrase n=1 Tax=Rugosimonospora africana TaxID=556532 RepID=UPI001EF298A8|nr:tyrosine-type recombinase/integrase [Rugosimonospora africana]